jgi:hypothetical protein
VVAAVHDALASGLASSGAAVLADEHTAASLVRAEPVDLGRGGVVEEFKGAELCLVCEGKTARGLSEYTRA